MATINDTPRSLETFVVWIGDLAAPEFARLAPLAARQTRATRYADLATLENATLDDEPRWIVLLETRPGEHSAARLAGLRRRWPLAQVVVVYGVLSAGDTRTGRPLPGVLRVPIAATCRRLERLWAAHAPPLPMTATDEDRLLQILSHGTLLGQPRSANAPALAVLGPPPLATTISAACTTLGYRTIAVGLSEPPPEADGVLWIGAAGEASHRALANLKELRPNCPIVALLAFPLPEDAAALAELGVEHLLPLPLELPDLAAALAACVKKG